MNEALPALAIGAYYVLRLTDSIQAATWLQPEEKPVLAAEFGAGVECAVLELPGCGAGGAHARDIRGDESVNVVLAFSYGFILRGAAAAAEIAIINSIANLSGFVVPYLVRRSRMRRGRRRMGCIYLG
jgi:hypothetical protein